MTELVMLLTAIVVIFGAFFVLLVVQGRQNDRERRAAMSLEKARIDALDRIHQRKHGETP